MGDITYWNKFYSNNNTDHILDCSDFCNFIMDHFKDTKNISNVLDCGCGNGRDSYALANTYNVDGVDSSGYIPCNKNNVNFSDRDFVTMDKRKYELIYSRFTFHSITDDQILLFLDSINNNSYLVIETRSLKGEDDDVFHGKTHFRNYTDLNKLRDILTLKNFEITHINEDKGLAKYKDEDPICIRVICKKMNAL